MQRDGEGDPDERTWLRDETGGSVYLRLSTRQIEQPGRKLNPHFAQDVIDGATWLKEPGPNADLVIAYQGTVATEAIAAAGMLGDRRRDIGVLSITSADRLNAGWQAAQRARSRGHANATSHIERMLAPLPSHCRLVTVIDGHPATLSWLGGVQGHRTVSLGVEHFGQTGTVNDLYRHYGIDAASIAEIAANLTSGRPFQRRLAGYRMCAEDLLERHSLLWLRCAVVPSQGIRSAHPDYAAAETISSVLVNRHAILTP